MNITIVCAWYEVGMRHYSYTLLKSIIQNIPSDYKISIILVLRNNKECYPELIEFKDCDIKYIVIKNSILNIASKISPTVFDIYISRYIKSRKSDLLYILYNGVFFKNIKRIQKRCSILYTIHDLIPHEKNTKSIKDKWLSKTEDIRHKYLLSNADYLITNSEYQYHSLLDQGYKNAYCTPMPSLINTAMVNGDKSIPELSGLKDYILFFGRIDKYKGLDILVKTHLESNISVPLVIAGSGHIWFEVPITNKIVVINRYIKDEELRLLFNQAKVCLLPYISSTQTALVSIPFFWGCPTILSDIPAFKLISSESESLICNFNDKDEYQENINQIFENKTLNQQIIISQKRYYEKHYNEQSLSDKMLYIFRSIAQKNSI